MIITIRIITKACIHMISLHQTEGWLSEFVCGYTTHQSKKTQNKCFITQFSKIYFLLFGLKNYKLWCN